MVSTSSSSKRRAKSATVDGNLISSQPVTAETVVTETQALELLERNQS
jgi:hypothetical protein